MTTTLGPGIASRRDTRNARADRAPAYVAFCARGGSAPFRELVASAGLQSPFGEEALAPVIGAARRYLKAAEPI